MSTLIAVIGAAATVATALFTYLYVRYAAKSARPERGTVVYRERMGFEFPQAQSVGQTSGPQPPDHQFLSVLTVEIINQSTVPATGVHIICDSTDSIHSADVDARESSQNSHKIICVPSVPALSKAKIALRRTVSLALLFSRPNAVFPHIDRVYSDVDLQCVHKADCLPLNDFAELLRELGCRSGS